jgi:hypothetical protein
MARMPFERKLDGHICSDPKKSLFVRLKTLVASGILHSTSLYFALRVILQMYKMVPTHFVWILFFAVDHIYEINIEQL